MRLEGKITAPKGRKNRYWAVEIPVLEIHTQGKSRADAYRMAKDAIESLVGKKGFKVTVHPGGNDDFTITSQDERIFLAFILGRLRSTNNLTTRQVAENLESSSPTSYARYEQGKAMPRLDTLEALLKAINPDLELVLKAA